MNTLTASYILHTRPYGNTSLILECFTESTGRVALLARNARGPKSRYRGQLQLFTPMMLSWSGRHELKNLNTLELHGVSLMLNQQALLCGFYMNELMMRLLHKEDPHPALLSAYDEALHTMASANTPTALSIALRLFEKTLLHELGYGLPFSHLQSNLYYQFRIQEGFSVCASHDQETVFYGEDLLNISNNALSSSSVLKAAKRLMRLALNDLLDGRPLLSRDLL